MAKRPSRLFRSGYDQTYNARAKVIAKKIAPLVARVVQLALDEDLDVHDYEVLFGSAFRLELARAMLRRAHEKGGAFYCGCEHPQSLHSSGRGGCSQCYCELYHAQSSKGKSADG